MTIGCSIPDKIGFVLCKRCKYKAGDDDCEAHRAKFGLKRLETQEDLNFVRDGARDPYTLLATIDGPLPDELVKLLEANDKVASWMAWGHDRPNTHMSSITRQGLE